MDASRVAPIDLPHLALLRAGTDEADIELRRRGLLRGVTSRQRCGDYCEVLVARHLDGVLANVNNPGYDLTCNEFGRVEVKGRSLASVHLNWIHIRGVDRRAFDFLAVVEVAVDWTVAGSWILSYDDLLMYRHRRKDGRDVEPTKLSIRRDSWKSAVRVLDLAPTQAVIP